MEPPEPSLSSCSAYEFQLSCSGSRRHLRLMLPPLARPLLGEPDGDSGPVILPVAAELAMTRTRLFFLFRLRRATMAKGRQQVVRSSWNPATPTTAQERSRNGKDDRSRRSRLTGSSTRPGSVETTIFETSFAV